MNSRFLEFIHCTLIVFGTLICLGLSVTAQNTIYPILPQEETVLFDSTVVFEWNSSLQETPSSNYKLEIFADSTASSALFMTTTVNHSDSITISTAGVYYWTVSLMEKGRKVVTSMRNKFTYTDVFKLPNLNLLFLTDTGLILNSNNKVSRWINLADTSRSAVQSVDSLRPKLIFNDSLINGSSILRFDGNDDHLSVIQSVNLAELYTLSNWEGGATFNALKGLITGRIGGVIFRGAPASTTFGTSQVFPNSIYINRVLSNDFAPLKDYKLLFGRRNTVFPITNGLLFGSDFKVSNRYWDGHIGDVMGFSAPLNDSLHKIVVAYYCQKYRQPLSLGKDIVTPYGFCDTLIRADTNYVNYLWSNGDTTSTTLLRPGKSVGLTVTNDFGCSYSDEIHARLPLPVFSDVQICPGDSLVWNTFLNKNDFTFRWNDLTTDSLLIITTAGDYHLEVIDTNNCSYFSDTISIGVDSSIIDYSLGKDTALCEGSFIGLINGDTSIQSYIWNTGSTLPQISIDTSGIYILQFANLFCTATDTIRANVKGKNPAVKFSFDGKFLGDTTRFSDKTVVFGTDTVNKWHWMFGDDSSSFVQNPSHYYQDTGKYDVKLIVESDKSCTDSITKSLRIRPRPEVIRSNKSQNGITIVSPKDESVIFDERVTLSWNAFPDPNQTLSYVVCIAKDSSFLMVDVKDTVQSTVDTVTLITNQKYYWKVEAIHNHTIVASSVKISFTVSNLMSLPYLNLLFLTDTGLQINAQSTISKWNNLADTSLSAVQSSANSMPTVQKDIVELNGNSAIKFDGTDDYLSVSSQFNLAELYTIANYEGGQTFDALKGLITGRVGGTIFRAAGGSSSIFGNSQVFGDSIFINGQNTKEFAPLASYKWVFGKRNSSFPIGSGIYFGSDFLISNRHWNGGIADIIGFESPISDSSRNIVKSYFCKKYRSDLSLGKDLLLNYGFCDTLFQADTSFIRYQWSNGDTTSHTRLLPGQQYTLTVTNDIGCKYVDNIKVRLPIRHQENVMLCPGDSLIWDTKLSIKDYSFIWNNGEKDSSETFSLPGEYSVQITDTNGCAYQSHTIQLSFDSSLLSINLGNDTSICRGARIALNKNAGIKNYNWSNGSSSPSIEIDSSGTYSVVFKNQMCTNSDTIEILIKGDPPKTNFTFENLCFKDEVIFNDSSSVKVGDTIVKWVWNFGDGTADTVENPKHTYLEDKRYTVDLQVTTDKKCIHDTSFSFTIKAKPKAGFTSQKSCVRDAIQFRDQSNIDRGSIVSYAWQFGDTLSPANKSFEEDPRHVFDTFGTYFVELIVESNQGCKDTLVQSKFINPLPEISYNALGNCLSDSIEFISTSTLARGNIDGYLWVINNQQLNVQQPRIKFLNAGEKQVILRLRTDSSCQNVLRDTISIFEKPTADILLENYCKGIPFIVDDRSTSADSLLSYTYIFKGDTIKKINPQFISDSAGIFELKHIVRTINSCVDTNQYSIQINENPSAQFTVLNNNTGIPFKLFLKNNSLGASEYRWNFGNGDTSSQETPNYTYTDTGSFQLQLLTTSEKGCVDSVTQEVNVLPKMIDAALENLFLNEQEDGSVEITVRILNTGSNTLNTLELIADLNNEFELKETFLGPLFNGNQQSYTFQSRFLEDQGRRVDFVCVRIGLANNDKDRDPLNNELCAKGFNDEFRLNAYPNPVNEMLNIEYVLPAEGKVGMKIFDALGRESILPISLEGKEGYYTSQINVSSLKNGLYFYVFSFKGRTKLIKFFKH